MWIILEWVIIQIDTYIRRVRLYPGDPTFMIIAFNSIALQLLFNSEFIIYKSEYEIELQHTLHIWSILLAVKYILSKSMCDLNWSKNNLKTIWTKFYHTLDGIILRASNLRYWKLLPLRTLFDDIFKTVLISITHMHYIGWNIHRL
jgi:hypothetical protein